MKIDKTRHQAPLADRSPKRATEYDMKADTRIAMDAAGLVPRPKYGPIDESKHLVQFYDDATLLTAAVATYIAEALETGASGLVIATKPHVADIEDRLRARGIDLNRVAANGQYVALDAAETLAAFVRNEWPDQQRFLEVVGAMVAAAARRSHVLPRIFGEMVALLYIEGKRAAAVRLEELWNDLAKTERFSLLCAYPMQCFAKSEDTEIFGDVCNAHSRVIPADGYTALASVDERLHEIGALQQKAAALEAEIAERQQIERLLKRRELELEDFLENGMEGLHRVGADGTILWANRAELQLLGYARDEYVGHHIAEFHADREVIEDILARLLRGESLLDCPARLRHKDGTIREVLINSNGYWENGQFLYTRCFTRDVTDVRRTERERTELLFREQTARMAAEQANHGKDQFLAVLSHELRTPLTSILGWVRMLRSGQLNEAKTIQALQVIERSAHLQIRLVDDLLDVSRIITGKLVLDVRSVDLAEEIQAAVQALRPTTDSKGVELWLRIDPAVGLIRGDPDRCRQIVTNLVSNAVKYTPSGGRVSVVLRRVATCAQIIVTDTGIGISAAFMPRVFDRFAQATAVTSRTQSGLGLGLSITRHLVEFHGGAIRVESPGEGQGATFTVELPIVDVANRRELPSSPR